MGTGCRTGSAKRETQDEDKKEGDDDDAEDPELCLFRGLGRSNAGYLLGGVGHG